MKEHPILFQTEMEQAILQGRKTMTRRVVTKSNCKPVSLYGYGFADLDFNDVVVDGIDDFHYLKISLPTMETRHHIYSKWEVGDTLWVREMLHQNGELGLNYVANGEHIDEAIIPEDYPSYRNYAFCNIPSIHMPKWACRITLKITNIKVERVQDISEEDAMKEGVDLSKVSGDWEHTPVQEFESLWVKINGQESWDSNPFCWCVEFEKR